MSRIHWVARGTGTPKDRDEVNRLPPSEKKLAKKKKKIKIKI
jgi:hypothetical protein